MRLDYFSRLDMIRLDEIRLYQQIRLDYISRLDQIRLDQIRLDKIDRQMKYMKR